MCRSTPALSNGRWQGKKNAISPAEDALPDDEVVGIAEYEGLRSHALGEAPIPLLPLGLAVLRRRGVGAWLAHAVAARRLETLPPPAEESVRAGGAALGTSTCELVRLLAGTALLVMKVSSR